MNEPYLYQTFKQFKTDGSRPVFMQVICKKMKAGELKEYTLLNLDGSLNTVEIAPDKFSELVSIGVMQEWKP
jgi:hypothetical protein